MHKKEPTFEIGKLAITEGGDGRAAGDAVVEAEDVADGWDD